jgi:hypothetical protein
MEYAGLNAGIASWWGRGDLTDRNFNRILRITAKRSKRVRWTVYYEAEGKGDPSVAQIRSDLHYLISRYGRRRSYLHISKRPVVFVYGESEDCDTATRWKQANDLRVYVVLKLFHGYRTCGAQPDGWHQYGPSSPVDWHRGDSYSISPGFWRADENAPRLARDLRRWRRDARAMAASHERFQLVTTFNEWGEGTAVESAFQWKSRSGFGSYLDVLHRVLKGAPAKNVHRRHHRSRHHHRRFHRRHHRHRHRHHHQSGAATLLAAGDIASCKGSGDEATARILGRQRGTIAPLGDTVYDSGSPQEFAQCYAPSWGRYKRRTRPAVGNHEYKTPGAAGYFDYFGAAAGPRSKGYYGYNRGSWHIVVLNANCSKVSSCSAGSPQLQWLRRNLASHRRRCTLAYWHQPRFSSGHHGGDDEYVDFWRVLYNAHADVVLSGHDHDYERFRPLTPTGTVDPDRGIVEFIVGTGGKNHYKFSKPQPPISVVRNDDTFGILKLDLRRGGYRWRFIPESGKSFTDSGARSCH